MPCRAGCVQCSMKTLRRSREMRSEDRFGKVSRRQFMGGLAVSSAAFTILPGAVLGLNGATPPSEKLNIASVGAAGKAASDIDGVKSQNIVALCDVDWAHAAGTFKQF